MNDPVIRGFMDRTIYEEIIPTLDLPTEELREFAGSVAERFQNPFIDHELLSISLNSTAKWRARVLPSLREYIRRRGTLPQCLTASLAFYIAFYSGAALTDDGMTAQRGNSTYIVRDDRSVLEFFIRHRQNTPAQLAQAVCQNIDFWGEDLTRFEGLAAAVGQYLEDIRQNGAYQVMKALL